MRHATRVITKPGNLTSLDGRAIPVNHATNRLTGSSYDAAGNELNWGTGSLTFNYTYYPGNQIRTITGGSPAVNRIYAYTADGERIAAYADAGPDAGVTYTLRDLEGHVLRQYLESGGTWTWKEDYVWGPTGLLATVSREHGTKHYVNDHLGSPRLVYDRGGAEKARHTYWPFGEEFTPAGQDHERIKFTGHERDLGLNGQTTDDLDYMHARYYTFNLGRFMSVDPVGGSVGSSQSWNRYSYVHGNPINATDPTGMLTNQYLGLEDRPANQGKTQTTLTVDDAWWTSVTWPASPNAHIPSRQEAFQRAIEAAAKDALANGLLAVPGASAMGSDFGTSGLDIDALVEAREWTLLYARIEHHFLPFVAGSFVMASGANTLFAGAVTFTASIGAIPESGGLSLIATGASVPVMSLGLYQAVWGASVVIDQTNAIFGTHIWSPTNSLPAKWFPSYPYEH